MVLPDVDPFSENFTRFFVGVGDRKLKCHNNETRRQPWVEVVDGDKVVFSVPASVRGNVTCRIHGSFTSTWHRSSVLVGCRHWIIDVKTEKIRLAS
jgi:hypothetical protein